MLLCFGRGIVGGWVEFIYLTKPWGANIFVIAGPALLSYAKIEHFDPFFPRRARKVFELSREPAIESSGRVFAGLLGIWQLAKNSKFVRAWKNKIKIFIC